MNTGESILSFLKLTATVAGAAVAGAPVIDIFNHYIQTPVWGIPVTVIGAAGAGAVLSLFFGDPLTTRRELFGQTFAASVFGAAVAWLAARALQWDWAISNMSMFALVSAAMLRWFLPSVIERGKSLIKEFRFTLDQKKKGDE